MIGLREIKKSEIKDLLEDRSIWDHEFLAVSKHRLLSHLHNPNAADDDIVLVLGYLNSELVGYMGAFIDYIQIDGESKRIAWLSTWWVHPKTKGSGIGRMILDTMYNAQDGYIGISQFTPSAKRVYDKSGYFYDLQVNPGVKAVLRSNLQFVIPAHYPKWARWSGFLNSIDRGLNLLLGVKIAFHKAPLKSRLKGVTLEYLNRPDADCMQLVKDHGDNPLSVKDAGFFEWIKAYHWVQEAPLLEFTNKGKYEFSIYDETFNIYLIKVVQNGRCVGFLVLQKRRYVCKLLFAYYEPQAVSPVADVIKLQCATQDVREIICYDRRIAASFKKSGMFLYTTDKNKHSIISKAFGKSDFSDVKLNFGDGDCSFA